MRRLVYPPFVQIPPNSADTACRPETRPVCPAPRIPSSAGPSYSRILLRGLGLGQKSFPDKPSSDTTIVSSG